MWSGIAPLSATRSTRVSRFIVWMVFALVIGLGDRIDSRPSNALG